MANDRSHPLETLSDRLFPNNGHPSDFIRVGLDHRSRHSNSEGVVNRSYDIPLLNGDGSPYSLTNVDINNIHRVLESLALGLKSQRETTRDIRYYLHANFFGAPYRIFTETYYDSIWGYNSSNEVTWNGSWNPPVAVPPVDQGALLLNGQLLHNAYDSSISYDPKGSAINKAGTYRTVNLAIDDIPYTPEYFYQNTWSPISIIGGSLYFKPIAFSNSTAYTIENTGVYLVILVHANKEFWSKYWTSTLNTEQGLACGNRFTVYYKSSSGTDPDTDYNLLYLPHVPSAETYGINTSSVSNKIFGKLINVMDPIWRPNSDVSTPASFFYEVEANGDISDDVLTPEWVSTNITSTIAPSGLVNNTALITDTPDIFYVDVSLTPGAKIYSWSIQLVRRLTFNMKMAGMTTTTAD